MGKYVKTTKGIYELTPNRKIIDYKRLDLQSGKTINAKRLVDLDVDQDTWENGYPLGEIVAQSDNLNDLIEKFGIKDTKTNEIVYIGDVHHSKDNVKELKNLLDDYNRVTEDTHTLIGFIVINDDIVKVTEMNKEGEWKLYER